MFVPDSMLFSEQEKYIWIGDSGEEHKNAQYLFADFMHRNIYIKGFASSAPSLIGLSMYHKLIYDIDTLDRKETVVFYDNCFEASKECITYRGKKATSINQDIKKENVVIWGAGITGEYVFRILTDHGVGVKFFVDSNQEKRNGTKFGLPVYMPEQLEEMEDDFTIVEALEQWRQIDKSIEGKWEKRFHFNFLGDILSKPFTCTVNDITKKIFSLTDFSMFHRFEDKKVYIYGNGVIEKEFARYLKLMDYDFGGFLVDEYESNMEGGKNAL